MNLEKLNVQELSTSEMKTIEGEFLGIAIGIAIAVVGLIFATDGNKRTITRVNGHRVGN